MLFQPGLISKTNSCELSRSLLLLALLHQKGLERIIVLGDVGPCTAHGLVEEQRHSGGGGGRRGGGGVGTAGWRVRRVVAARRERTPATSAAVAAVLCAVLRLGTTVPSDAHVAGFGLCFYTARPYA